VPILSALLAVLVGRAVASNLAVPPSASIMPSALVHDESAPASASAAASGPVNQRPAVRGAPREITVGLYLQNVPEIDVKTNTFSAELYLWFLWNGDIDPTQTYQLTNALNAAELSRTPVYADASGAPRAETLADGRHYQIFHVYGRFSHPFPLARYPFDEHDIVISIEDSQSASDVLIHRVDEAGSAMRPDLSIPGWSLQKMTYSVGRSRFATNFGDPRATAAQETYSRVDFSVHITRPVVGLFSKTVVPIAIIIIITFGAFFLHPEYIDARLCLTITALISAVALQFTAATELPPAGYLLVLDKIYLLSYAIILGVTFFAIAAHRKVVAEQLEAAKKLDRAGLVSLTALYVVGLAFMIVVRR
jgi:hypothetical protein